VQVPRPYPIGYEAVTAGWPQQGETLARCVTVMIMTIVMTTRVCPTSTEGVLNSIMASEPWFGPAATRMVETTEQKNERWTEGDYQSRVKIANLGPRRSRSGRSRCLEDLRKCLECRRSGEAPSTAQR